MSASQPTNLSQNESEVMPILGLRMLSLYMLSLLAVINAILVYEGANAIFFVWGIALALALIAGISMGPRIEEFRDRLTNWKGGLTGWILYLLAAAWILAMMLDPVSEGPNEGAAADDWVTLLYFQPVMLFAGGLGAGYRGAIMNAFILTVVSSYAGGDAAAQAIISFVGTLGFFLVFDHWARKLLAYPRGPVPHVSVPIKQTLTIVAPVVILLVFWFHQHPPSKLETIARFAKASTAVQRENSPLWQAIFELLISVVIGALLVYLISRYFDRDKDKDKRGGLEAEVLLQHSHEEEALRKRGAGLVVDYSGARGRIVHAYVEFLKSAWTMGLKRRPWQTAREFAERAPGQHKHLRVLTLMFEKARYGDDEPTDGEVQLVEKITGVVSSRWGRVGAVITSVTRRLASLTQRRVRPDDSEPSP